MRGRRLLFFSNQIWRYVFRYKQNVILKLHDKYFTSRSSRIPICYIGYTLFIYNGKTWQTRKITRWVTGFKIGELTWNRKIALYKAKQQKKKKK